MTEIQIAFEKAEAIIHSCETCDHFENAQAYINLFNEKFNDYAYYTALLSILDLQKKKINCLS